LPQKYHTNFVYNIRKNEERKNEDVAKIIMLKKITIMQQRSTVDSRRRLTNSKMLISQCE